VGVGVVEAVHREGDKMNTLEKWKNMLSNTTTGADIVETLSADHSLLPQHISPSVEGETCIVYVFINRKMIIEPYDDGDIALIITDEIKRETIYREDIQNMDFAAAVNAFCCIS
jgi:hypothetical protein